MNLALPALVILLGLLPGVACFYGYFAGRFDRRTAGLSGVEELALYVVLAIPINACALSVCRLFGLDLDFTIAARLVGGTLSDQASAEVAAAIRAVPGRIATVYVLLLVGSFLIGSFFRRFVWACRLDVRFLALRLRHSWFYVLQGREAGRPRNVIAMVDVLTTHPDGSRLYRGIVGDFEISPQGKIDTLTLTKAIRGSGRGEAFKWIAIPSDRLTVMGDKIHSINVTYYDVALAGPTGLRARMTAATLTWLRSFFLQEP